MKTGARFDSVAWARKCSFFTHGSMTFKEAYLRTGRILNISVIPADRHSPTKLLNYITAPDTVIWSTLLASAAVPGILNPVVIMQKLKDGTIVPWNWGSRFKDGSLRVDIPTQALNLYFNVTNPVVSQVNPHVHLFFFAPRGSPGKPVAHRKGKGWRGNFLLSAAEQWLKHELTKNFKVIRDLELLPTLLGQDWSSVFLQRFDGAITIWPRTRFADWMRILSDPDPAELQRLISSGQMATWPKLHMIGNRSRIEKQILLGRQEVRKMLKPKPSRPLNPLDYRSALLTVPSSDGHHARPNPVVKMPSQSPPSTSKERPLALDTDAEDAFADGSSWYFRRGRRSPSPRAANGRELDPLISPAIRKKWASDLLDLPLPGPDTTSRHVEPSPTRQEEPSNPPPSPSMFARFRGNSMSFMNSFKGLSSAGRNSDADETGVLDCHSSSSDDSWLETRSNFRMHSPALTRHASEVNYGGDDMDF